MLGVISVHHDINKVRVMGILTNPMGEPKQHSQKGLETIFLRKSVCRSSRKICIIV